MKEFNLGSREQWGTLPAEVEIESKAYYLVQTDEGGWRLLSRVCPHAGFKVEVEDDEIVCPLHGWSFDLHTGACKNVPVKALASYPVELREGSLIVQFEA